jgi:hypothetical protein
MQPRCRLSNPELPPKNRADSSPSAKVGLAEQIQLLRAQLAALGQPATPQTLAQAFKGASAAKVAELLAAMEVLGQARSLPDQRFAA